MPASAALEMPRVNTAAALAAPGPDLPRKPARRPRRRSAPRGQKLSDFAGRPGMTLALERLASAAPGRRDAIERRAQQTPSKLRMAYLRAAAGVASPRQAIRLFCLNCACYVRNEVRLCTALACPLHSYRTHAPLDQPPSSAVYSGRGPRSTTADRMNTHLI